MTRDPHDRRRPRERRRRQGVDRDHGRPRARGPADREDREREASPWRRAHPTVLTGNPRRPPAVGPHVRIEVWSDVVCPWCYIGKRHLESALETFEHHDEVELVYRSFELDPTAPEVPVETTVESLAKKF